MPVVQQTNALIELRSGHVPVKDGEEHPTVFAEVGTWKTENGNSSGVAIDVFGVKQPLLSAADARKLGKWLLRAAEELDGKPAHDKKNKTRRRYDDEEEEQTYDARF